MISPGINFGNDDVMDSNASINKLNKMCEDKLYPTPVFELTQEYGPAHDKTFHYDCKISKFFMLRLIHTSSPPRINLQFSESTMPIDKLSVYVHPELCTKVFSKKHSTVFNTFAEYCFF